MSRTARMWQMVLRCLLLLLSSIVAMSALGVIAYIVATRGRGMYGDVIPELIFPAAVGAFVGVFSTPFVVASLHNAHLARSLLCVYGVSLLVTVLWCLVIPIGIGITAAGPATMSVVIMSAHCRHRYALAKQVHNRCEQCDYDLSGCTDSGCPECGWGREKPSTE